MNKKNIEIFPYDPTWPKIFAQEALLIKKILGDRCLQIHHFGSTAIPGLWAKRDIDILCVVEQLPHSLVLQEHEFLYKGELNIPLRFYFSKNSKQSKVNLHVVEANHGFIALNLCVRDYLRTHEQDRDDYAALKQELIQQPTSCIKQNLGFTGYTLGKNQFIKSILQKAKFDGMTVNFCLHQDEWQEYHRICKEQIYLPKQKNYEKDFPIAPTNTCYYFVLSKGATVISIAQIELLSEKEAALRCLATDKPYQQQGYGTYLMQILEQWLKLQKCLVLKLHTELLTEQFYRNLGYDNMPFFKENIAANTINLGKIL